MSTGRNNGTNADAPGGHGSGPDGQMTGDWAYLQHAMNPNYSGLGQGNIYGPNGAVLTIAEQDQRYQQAARQAQAYLSQRGAQSYQGNRQHEKNPNLNRTDTQSRQLRPPAPVPATYEQLHDPSQGAYSPYPTIAAVPSTSALPTSSSGRLSCFAGCSQTFPTSAERAIHQLGDHGMISCVHCNATFEGSDAGTKLKNHAGQAHRYQCWRCGRRYQSTKQAHGCRCPQV